MAKKIYVRNNINTEWIPLGISLPNASAYLTQSSASTTYATIDYLNEELSNIDLSLYLTESSASTTYATINYVDEEISNINVLPSQTGNDGKFLTTSGSAASWATVDLIGTINTASAAAVTYLTNSTQEILDTLNALSAALGEDANFATTVTNSLSEKLNISTASATYQTIVQNVSNTEIGYLDGVTSGIQTQLNDKASLGSAVFSAVVTAPMLRLTSTIDTLDNTGNFGFQIGQSVSENLRIDNNEILALNNDVKSTLNIQKNGGQVLIAGSVVDGSSVGLEVGGPIRLKSSRNAANNTRGIESMSAKIAVSSTDDRQELQIYSSGDSYSTGSRGAGMHLYGTDDSQHASNVVLLTGPPDQGNARIIVSGGTGTTGYLSGATTYTRTNTDTRVTIGNSMWDWVDEKNDTGLLNLKDPSDRPAIYATSSGATDGTTYGTIAVETGQSFGVGHWSGTSYTNRFSINSSGDGAFAGSLSVSGILDIAEVRETVVSNSFSTNVMTANYNNGAIHYATVAPTGNFTISLTNVPTTTLKSITMSFLITQGATGYIPTTLNLNGVSQTIRWVGGTAPTPTSTAGKIDIFNFTLILAASNVLIASSTLNI